MWGPRGQLLDSLGPRPALPPPAPCPRPPAVFALGPGLGAQAAQAGGKTALDLALGPAFPCGARHPPLSGCAGLRESPGALGKQRGGATSRAVAGQRLSQGARLLYFTDNFSSRRPRPRLAESGSLPVCCVRLLDSEPRLRPTPPAAACAHLAPSSRTPSSPASAPHPALTVPSLLPRQA